MAAVALNLKCGMQSNCHRRLSSASLLRAASSTVKPPFTIFSLTLKRTSSTYSFNCSPCTLIHVGTLRNSVWSWHTLLFELLKNKKRKQCLIKYCTVIKVEVKLWVKETGRGYCQAWCHCHSSHRGVDAGVPEGTACWLGVRVGRRRCALTPPPAPATPAVGP